MRASQSRSVVLSLVVVFLGCSCSNIGATAYALRRSGKTKMAVRTVTTLGTSGSSSSSVQGEDMSKAEELSHFAGASDANELVVGVAPDRNGKTQPRSKETVAGPSTQYDKMLIRMDIAAREAMDIAAREALHTTKMGRMKAANAKEVQSLQSRLEKMAKDYQDYKVTTHRHQVVQANQMAEKRQADLRMRLQDKDKQLRDAETVVAHQKDLINELSADRSSLKKLSQQALEVLRRRAVSKVGRLAASASIRFNTIKHRVAPQRVRDGGLDQDDYSDSEFADWNDDPKGLVSSAWWNAKFVAKTLRSLTRRMLESIASRATEDGLWEQPILLVQRIRGQILPPEDAIPEEKSTFKRMVRVTDNGDGKF
jgi:hypothetical protein